MIERHAVGTATAAIMAGDGELFEAELAHDHNLIPGMARFEYGK